MSYIIVRRFLAPRMNGQFTITSQIPDNLLRNRLTLEAMKLFRHIITIGCLVAPSHPNNPIAQCWL